jgi:Tol biopolymer transport system component
MRITTLKNLIGLMLGLSLAFTSDAAGQGPGEMLAYDTCQSEYWLTGGDGGGNLICSVFLMTLDGSTNVAIGDGLDPAFSADGSRLAFGGSSQPGIFVLNLSDWSLVKLISGGQSPAWSPDGTKLAFAGTELYVMDADGSNVTALTNNIGFRGQPAWSPDGGTIAFDCEVEIGNRDICSINADGTGFVRLTSDPAWESGAVFSPDGFMIAGNGFQFAWSPDGTLAASVLPFEGACQADGYICPDYITITDMDGETTFIARGNRPSLAVAVHPVGWFVSRGCNGLTCTFDGSASWGGTGGVVTYAWTFGDGTSATGPTPSRS